MTRASIPLALLAAAAAMGMGEGQAAPQHRSADSAAGPLGFDGAYLGMSLEAWRRAPFPGTPNPHTAPTCTAGAGSTAAGLTKASAAATTEVCAYVSRYGSAILTEDVPWTQGLLAKSPRYVFTGGRLTRIDIHVGIDAFDKVMARMKARYGAPSRMVRDNMKTRVGALSRVTVRWKTPAGAIELVDPTADLANMTISFIDPAAHPVATAG